MTDVKQQGTKFDSKQPNEKECNDKKRKRSRSPAEAYQKSPMPQKVESEPDLEDETAMILSWCKCLSTAQLAIHIIIPVQIYYLNSANILCPQMIRT